MAVLSFVAARSSGDVRPASSVAIRPDIGFAARSFLIRVLDAGQIDESFQATISDFHLLDLARQSDGKFLAAGRRLNEGSLDSDSWSTG